MNAPDKIYLTPLLVEGCGKNLSKRVTENDAVYIREDLIKAEIERLMDEYKPVVGGTDELTGAHIVLAKLLSFLSTTENKSARQRLAEWSKTPEGRESYEKVAEEMRKQIAPNDLEEAAKEFAKDAYPDKHNLVWMFKRGAKWQKEQMMKEAIHYVVQDDLDSHGASYNIPFIRIGIAALKPKGIGVGDKVRIIIVKED